jgi:hypothetical protein
MWMGATKDLQLRPRPVSLELLGPNLDKAGASASASRLGPVAYLIALPLALDAVRGLGAIEAGRSGERTEKVFGGGRPTLQWSPAWLRIMARLCMPRALWDGSMADCEYSSPKVKRRSGEAKSEVC